ncbi:MAG: thioredoxin domain-containing protein [Acidobacteriota bacterium]
MSNRLSGEKSPYLLQHAENPVDWYPWGEEAFDRARREDKPIFLSIGYATCHWCHVMEHESFEDEEAAGLLNEHFVSIKVDREERPDVDHIYMTTCQALTGSGGWPLSIFMTPDRKPFFAATYIPKNNRRGMLGLMEVVTQLSYMWRTDRERLVQASEDITRAIQPRDGGGEELSVREIETAYRQLRRVFDEEWGGFGNSPKFPTAHSLSFLLRWHRRNPDSDALAMTVKTLDAMRDGGIYDQVGFGFHRYSVDHQWLVPHFEKMLYDQAMISMAYIEAFQLTGIERYATVAREVFEYVLRDMTDGRGGFYSAEDADSEGEEGLFYVWTPREVEEVLGRERGGIFCRFFDITGQGNFEHGKSIPHLTGTVEARAREFGFSPQELADVLEDSRKKLFEARKGRIHPFKDDKILTSWNGLMIAALAKGYQALHDTAYLDAASRAVDFILSTLRDGSGRLFRRYRHGEVAHPAFADDYAFLIWGLIELYEASFDVRYLEEALALQKRMADLFWDEPDGGFFYTPEDGEKLIVRDREAVDGAIPSSNSVAAANLLRLYRMTGNEVWQGKADQLLSAFAGMVREYPSSYTHFLASLDFALGPTREIVIAGDPTHGTTRRMVEAVQELFMPNRVVMLREPGEASERLARIASFTEPLRQSNGTPLAYVCENYACRRPVSEVEELKALLEPH